MQWVFFVGLTLVLLYLFWPHRRDLPTLSWEQYKRSRRWSPTQRRGRRN